MYKKSNFSSSLIVEQKNTKIVLKKIRILYNSLKIKNKNYEDFF